MSTTSPTHWTAPFSRQRPVMSPPAPPLRLSLLNIVWNLLIKVAHFYIWAAEQPFNAVRSISPTSIKPYVQQAGDLVWSFAGPAINWTYNTSYWALDTVDYWVDRLSRQAWGVTNANVRHFKVAMEAYLRLIENKATTIEQNGFSGIPVALGLSSPKGAKAA